MRNKKLIELRESKELTQEDMAKLLNISRSFYGHIETGTRNPSYGLAKKIASIFEVKVEEIFFNLDSFRLKLSKDTPPTIKLVSNDQ